MIERTCIVCKKKFEQSNLNRIVLCDNHILLQKSSKLNGRGAYICNNTKCIDNLIKTKALNRTFKREINLQEYQNLINNLKN